MGALWALDVHQELQVRSWIESVWQRARRFLSKRFVFWLSKASEPCKASAGPQPLLHHLGCRFTTSLRKWSNRQTSAPLVSLAVLLCSWWLTEGRMARWGCSQPLTRVTGGAARRTLLLQVSSILLGAGVGANVAAGDERAQSMVGHMAG